MMSPTTIRTEGGLLPPDFLQRLTGFEAGVPGLTPDSYHLAGEKLNEAASRAWNRLLGVWTAFQSAAQHVAASDPATTVTREKWLLPMFAELGYGRLQPARAIEIDGKSYPISHAWQQVPVHLVGSNVGLDRRTAGVAGAARTSPHGLVQDLLNRRSESLWGFVSNGLKLRLLRDNRSLTRQAYVEFDLAAMMDGQAFSDFVLLWLVCHQSRVEGDPAETCWLEKWASAAREEGTRALDELREGVENAIKVLGRGFLKHPANGTLLDKLRSGAIDRQDYYRQLLRLVYRLIFLFVAEARDLLLVADPVSAPTQHYRRYYSMARLRDLAGQRRGTPHGDLWQALLVVFRGLSSEHGCPELGLPALGSFLWSDAAAPDLDTCQLANAHLLEGVRALGFRVERGLRRAVDWRNLGPEELGSVYESLLELHPDVDTGSATFSLRIAAGHERKTTGSYYTPTSLVECLLDSALDPVLDEAARAPDPERAILDLKVCDPACGSGHFLIAAAHRVAKRLAAVSTGEVEPSPEAVRIALRDVIGHCLYGVDVNPMAVELCKVNLWLEALTPGRPLSFLDHHIQCGNSLLGATPALLRDGIPDAAFDLIEGDDREYCRELKKRNRREREGFRNLFTGEPWERLGDLATGLVNLDEIDDSTLDGVRKKEARYAEIVRSTGYAHGRLWADAWCAAFVWPKTRERHPITEDLFRTIERNPMAVPEGVRGEVKRIAEEYRFFHWHLTFPDVFHAPRVETLPEGPGWTGGFDVILGNPPWEQAQVSEKEFFAERDPRIAALAGNARKRAISSLKVADPGLFEAFQRFRRSNDALGHLLRNTARYPLCATGKINSYAIFAELNRSLLSAHGRAGFIVPTGIATDDTTKTFFQDLVDRSVLVSLYDFRNKGFFPGAAGAQGNRFCLLTVAGSRLLAGSISMVFRAESIVELTSTERRVSLTSQDFSLLNPNTRTCPVFRTRRDAELTKAIYRRVPVLVHESSGEEGNPWGISFSQGLFNSTSDSHLFRTLGQLEADGWRLEGNTFRLMDERFVPLYEAKMIHQYNHRFGDYRSLATTTKEVRQLPDCTDESLLNPDYRPLPRYWVPDSSVREELSEWSCEWLLGWRDITSGLDERTVIASALPLVGVSDTLLLMFPDSKKPHCLLANLNSFAQDYAARQKIGGTHLKYAVFKQLAILPPSVFDATASWSSTETLDPWIRSRVLELVYTAWDLEAFACDLGWNGPPYRWDPERRFLIRCELDAAFFHLYGIGRDDVDYIMDTFPIVRRNDEAAHGEYRTKRVILEIFERMQHAIDTSAPYETLLDPPAADPRVAHQPNASLGLEA